MRERTRIEGRIEGIVRNLLKFMSEDEIDQYVTIRCYEDEERRAQMGSKLARVCEVEIVRKLSYVGVGADENAVDGIRSVWEAM